MPAALRWISSHGVALDVKPREMAEVSATPDSQAIVLTADIPNQLARREDSAYINTNAMAMTTSGGGGSGSQCKVTGRLQLDADILQLAISGLRQAESGGVQILASWAATADSSAVGDSTAAEFPAFMQGVLAAQSDAAEEHISLASNRESRDKSLAALPLDSLAAAIRNQQDCHAQQAQLLRTLAAAVTIEATGHGQLRKNSEKLMQVSREATERHLASAMDSLRLAFGAEAVADLK
jgi:hypothetical protein